MQNNVLTKNIFDVLNRLVTSSILGFKKEKIEKLKIIIMSSILDMKTLLKILKIHLNYNEFFG